MVTSNWAVAQLQAQGQSGRIECGKKQINRLTCHCTTTGTAMEIDDSEPKSQPQSANAAKKQKAEKAARIAKMRPRKKPRNTISFSKKETGKSRK